MGPYRTQRAHAINAASRAVIDEFIAEVDELRREERARYNPTLACIGYDQDPVASRGEQRDSATPSSR